MKFSIIIPSYNNAKWLKLCLNSIIKQTFQDFEIILVDDISTDNSVEVAKKYLRDKDTLIVNESKRLNGGTRNVGILRSKGEYILCIDCDDWLANNQVLEDIAKNLNGEDVMFTDYILHTQKGDTLIINKNKTIDDGLKNITCAIWTKVVKADILKNNLFPEGTLFEDRIQHYRLLLNISSFTHLNKPVIVWNRTNANTISGNNTDLWNTYRFNYIGELYRLIKELEDGWFREFLVKEAHGYLNQVIEMVNKL